MWLAIRSYCWYAAVIAFILFATVWMPRIMARVRVPDGFADQIEIEAFTLQWLDPAADCVAGDLIAFRRGSGDNRICFGRVAAVAGDVMKVEDNELQVSGQHVPGWVVRNAYTMKADLGPAVVPAGHVFVLSTRHAYDSVVRGPIPLGLVLGRIRK